MSRVIAQKHCKKSAIFLIGLHFKCVTFFYASNCRHYLCIPLCSSRKLFELVMFMCQHGKKRKLDALQPFSFIRQINTARAKRSCHRKVRYTVRVQRELRFHASLANIFRAPAASAKMKSTSFFFPLLLSSVVVIRITYTYIEFSFLHNRTQSLSFSGCESRPAVRNRFRTLA
jgi:hypothetical protein